MTRILLFFIFLPSFLLTQSIIHPVKVSKPFVFDKSKPLRDYPGIPSRSIDRSWKELIPNKIGFDRDNNRITDKSLQVVNKDYIQKIMGLNSTSQIINDWEGINNIDGYLPPDTQGDVGPNHYVQVVNSSFQIWDKSGNSLYGPFALGTIWQDFSGPWETSLNDGDPIVLYDQEADRWLISEFSLPNYPKGPYFELIAVSSTSDPTGEWYRYAYEFDDMPDYPKFGIWPDGYYMSTNNFFRGVFFNGAGASCFEREQMLVGNPDARLIYINLRDVPNGSEAASMLPADWDGDTPPPIGSPNYFTYFNDGTSSDNLRIWEFSVDWDNPTNSTISLSTTINASLFDSNVGTIPQPNTSQGLDALDDRLMYRFQFRNFDAYQAMVTNHTVDTDGKAGIKWYEMRNTGSGWFLYQEGTYAPDNENRWMGSIALDGNGNICLGYSVSSANTFPSIRYTGRLRDDPLGQMTFTETELVAGGGSQTHSSGRWGDYSMMSVDPIDNATFWFTTEYLSTTSSGSWRTRIGTMGLSLSADIKLILQGAYNSSTGLMNNSLGGQIPFTSPYNEDKITIASIPNDVVDWILVELRESPEGDAVASKSAFLRNDGKILDINGNDKVQLNAITGDYYIVIKHRNHLPIMSKNTVTLPNSTTYDFASGPGQYYGEDIGAVKLN